ncbi:MAG: hypothetical protein JWR30_2717 [Conexibacter sp.]|nr:hypothetical protein [Conexibacter sp.]
MPDAEPPPPRICPTCGKEGRTRFERCPHCRGSYFAMPRTVRRRRRLIAGAAGALVAVAIAAFVVVAAGDRSDRQARERTATAQRVAALRAKIALRQKPRHGAAPALRPPPGATDAQRLAARKALVGVVERRITSDARARARAGELDGPIVSTACGPILKSKTAIPDDRVLTKHIGRYDCVAIKKHIVDTRGANVAELGHAFVAALNFDTYAYTWCRNTPAQGERGVALVFVRLERACLAATGAALGTGYVAGTDATR